MNIKKLLKIDKKIVLASRSPRRKILLEQLGLDFEVFPSGFDESKVINEKPGEYVVELAYGKAETVRKNFNNSIIIGSDTTVYFQKLFLNKPETKEEAFEMLSSLSGNYHEVWSGICIINSDNGKYLKESVCTKVKFRNLLDEEIWAYIESGSPMDKAGAYGIQDDFGSVFVEKIEGDFYNVVGLPLEKLYSMLMRIHETE